MLIALLAVLGVNLIVLVVLAAIVLGRKRWLKRQAGQFFGAVRVTRGEVHGLKSRWKRGSGRWVRDVLVWSKGPFPIEMSRFRSIASPKSAKRVRAR
jgi:hypothetical protein